MSEDGGDPLDWSVDQVVDFLCHNSQTPWLNSIVRIRPDPVPFAEALRDNVITGEVLLQYVDMKALQEDLGIRALGHRASVIQAIQYLRKKSLKYHCTEDKPKVLSEAVSPVPYNADRAYTLRFGTSQPENVATSGPVTTVETFPVSALKGNPKSQRKQSEVAADSVINENSTISGPVTPMEPPSTSAHMGSPKNLEKRGDAFPAGDEEDHMDIDRHHDHPDESIVVDSNGRKRRRLQLMPQSQEGDSELIARTSNSDSHDKGWYMGPHKIKAAQLFYDANSDEEDQTFIMLGPKFPTAQRLFVKRSLGYSYRQQPVSLSPQNGASRMAVMPYKPLDEDKKKYFTLYTSEGGKVTVGKEDMAQWPELSGSKASSEALSLSDPYAYLLQKYCPEEGKSEEAYPAYGDSGSEGEYDEDTWQEMEDEQQHPGYGKQAKLSHAEVEKVVQECIANYENKWHEVKKPKEKHGARKLWIKAKRGKCRNQQIKFFAREIELQEQRLRKLQDTIRKNEYFAVSELKLVCQSMETTVHNVAKQRWRISVLEQQQCPPKLASAPEPRPKPKPKPKRDDEEESLGSESDDPQEDDFVEEDDFMYEDEVMNGAEVDQEVRFKSRDGSSTRLSPVNNDDDVISPSGKMRKSQSRKRNPLGLSSSSSRSPEFPNTDNLEHIDLTMDSPPAEELTVETPPLNPVVAHKDLPCSPNAFRDPEKMSISPAPQLSSQAFLEIPINRPKPPSDLPGTYDFAGLAKCDWAKIEERTDRGRLLAKLITCLPEEERDIMAETLPTEGPKRFKRQVRDALNVLTRSEREIVGLSASRNQLVMRTASLYISYVNCAHLSQEGISKHQIVNAQNDLSGFVAFHDVLCRHLAAYYDWNQSHEVLESQEAPVNGTSRKKRKKEVKESQRTKINQENAQERVQHQQKQEERFRKDWQNMGISNGDPNHQAVSFGDPPIYLHNHIGARIKPHQLKGIQFMWRELVQDENEQGCLLAHTMGLGKTMQVVAFLATLAFAANNGNPEIKGQIPGRFLRSQTLVLCPAALIENWYDEFSMWTPKSLKHRLGPLRKITTALSLNQRLQEAREWNIGGGILIMSYNIFRTWVNNKEFKTRQFTEPQRCFPDALHQEVMTWLLEGPNIIVADEAHSMKNSSRALYQATSQFRSKSRIAMTGSPLANNLTDYYTMVNWVSEGYLGEPKEFKANYVEPIEEGLYADSSYYEKRRSLVKLQVLKEILEPKVNRADISALKNDLPSKMEYVITIPLTRLQREAYDLYVDSVISGVDRTSNPKLMSWLAILSLCCNHPSCFWEKLNEKVNEAQKPGQNGQTQAVSPGDETIDQAGIPDSESLVCRQSRLFTDVTDLKALDLSYRVLILEKIISESVKAGDKILVFSHSLPTLNFIKHVLSSYYTYCYMDGQTPASTRQAATKEFNRFGGEQVYLISTRAGGQGLNIPGANRVIIFDFQFNPVWEEQAVGRVYRLGQQKPVFVYRFISGGTHEEKIFGKSIFKTHLANRVVDKKNPVRWATKSIGEYLQLTTDVPQKDLTEFIGKDPLVLDKIIQEEVGPERIIRKIMFTETLQREDNDNLTEEEKQGVQMTLSDERLKRTDPQAYQKLLETRTANAIAQQNKLFAESSQNQTYANQASVSANNNNNNWESVHPCRFGHLTGMPPPAHPASSSAATRHPRPPPPSSSGGSPLNAPNGGPRSQLSHNVGPQPLPPDMSVSAPPPTNGTTNNPFSAPSGPSPTTPTFPPQNQPNSALVNGNSNGTVNGYRIPHLLPARPPTPHGTAPSGPAPTTSPKGIISDVNRIPVNQNRTRSQTKSMSSNGS